MTQAAEAKGLRPGMRLGEALATCPELVLVEQDPAGVEQAWEEVLRRLEDAGFAVEPAEAGTVFFETRGVERLYGGLEPALKRALAAVGSCVGRAGRGGRAAVRGAGGGERGATGPDADRLRRSNAHVPRAAAADVAPARAGAATRSWKSLEYERSDSLPGCRVAPLPNVWGRTAGAPGAWREASTMDEVAPRRPPMSLVETLEFPDAVGQELTLRRGLGVLVDGLLARPERAGRPPRKLALWARLVGGASWRRAVTLREPTADPARLRLALGPKLAELPAPVLKLRLEAVELAASGSEQLELVRAEGDVVRGRLKEGLRQVKAAVGAGGVSMVVEVAPWSRIPEARALLVPRDD